MTYLIVFVKDPIPGQVKTRLASSIGKDHAASVYKELLVYTKSVIENLDFKTTIWYGNQVNNQDLWDGQKKQLQQGATLGERIKLAFDQAFESGAEKAIIIGSDCFDLNRKHLEEANKELNKADVVIGPAEDGGYYLLGSKKLHPSLFEDINWSSPSVLEETRESLRARKLSWTELGTLNDIDTEEDLAKSRPHLLENIKAQS